MNLDSQIVRRALLDLRGDLAHHAAWLPVRTSTRSSGGVCLAAAERELARVHVIEVGRLLREAAWLRREVDAEASVELHDWRRRARQELAGWRVDGFEGPATLRFCAARPIARWAGARAIAGEALALDPCDAGRRCLASVAS